MRDKVCHSMRLCIGTTIQKGEKKGTPQEGGGPIEAAQLPGGASLGQRTEGPKRFGGLTTTRLSSIAFRCEVRFHGVCKAGSF